MNRFYCIIIVFIMAIALLVPSKALAEPGQTLPHTTKYIASSAEVFFKRGVYEVLIEDYNSAIENFSQAINLNPNNAQAYSNQGLARAALGDRQGALKDFNQALHLDPKLVTAYYNRGFIRFKLQDHQAAIEDFNQAIEFDPRYADAYTADVLFVIYKETSRE